MNGRPHLAVMAKAPQAGAVKTRLCPPLEPDEAAALAHAFLVDAIALVRTAAGAIPALAFAPPEHRAFFAALAPGFHLVPQRGHDLGARLLHCVEDLGRAGAAAAIVIGTDSPTLPPAYLDRALARVFGVDVVLGPSADGGYYLIGLRHAWPELFQDIAWGSSAVLGETLDRARRLGLRVELLPPWFDVDTGADLDRLVASLTAATDRARHTRRFLAARRAGIASR